MFVKIPKLLSNFANEHSLTQIYRVNFALSKQSFKDILSLRLYQRLSQYLNHLLERETSDTELVPQVSGNFVLEELTPKLRSVCFENVHKVIHSVLKVFRTE
jgi:hypothetical protein